MLLGSPVLEDRCRNMMLAFIMSVSISVRGMESETFSFRATHEIASSLSCSLLMAMSVATWLDPCEAIILLFVRICLFEGVLLDLADHCIFVITCRVRCRFFAVRPIVLVESPFTGVFGQFSFF